MKHRAGKDTQSKNTVAREPIVFGRVIAERAYRVGRQSLVLQIGTPHRTAWKTDYYCPIRITCAGKPRVHRAFGVDSVQALMLAFALARALLQGSSPKISWDAGERLGDVGISKWLSTGFGAELRELEREQRGKAARTR